MSRLRKAGRLAIKTRFGRGAGARPTLRMGKEPKANLKGRACARIKTALETDVAKIGMQTTGIGARLRGAGAWREGLPMRWENRRMPRQRMAGMAASEPKNAQERPAPAGFKVRAKQRALGLIEAIVAAKSASILNRTASAKAVFRRRI